MFIFDLDGTLADASHRLPILKEDTADKWDRFFDACERDRPIWHNIAIFDAIHTSNADLVIWTGRSDRVLDATVEWLNFYTRAARPELRGGMLRMRQAFDHRPDDVLKREWLIELGPDRVTAAFEDRARVVKMYRELGVACLQVAEGEF